MKLMPTKRISASAGRTVVILGSDGAGKSTLVKNLCQSLSRKIDVYSLYMGLPKPSKSNNPLLAKLFRRLGLFPLWNTIVKRNNISKSYTLKSRGALVLCDRFPQHYNEGIMDGPLLNRWRNSSNPIKNYFSKLEHDLFKEMVDTKIDLVIKLIVDSETSARRGKHSLKMAEHKTRILSNLHFPNAIQTIELDASKMLEEQVMTEASIAIWNLYK
jgi:GTPase SAR1 family protein